MWKLFDEIVGKTIKCECGRVHIVPKIDFVFEDGISKNLGSFFKDEIFIADKNTFPLVDVPGERVIVLNDSERVLATMDRVKEVLKLLKEKKDLVSIGSGSLTDIARYASFLIGKNFSCFPTAPSVDAYTSSVSALIENGLKKTLKAVPPKRVVIDMDILVKAPFDLIRSGLGDMGAKVTARLDWILSNFLNGEHICGLVWRLMRDPLKSMLKNTGNILKRKKEPFRNLVDTLLLSGITMTMVGNSRPASGAEHIISHFLEMYYEMNGRIPLLHGLQVAMGTFVSIKAYEVILEDIPLRKSKISQEERENFLYETFGEKARGFLEIYEKKRKKRNVDLASLKRVISPTYLEFKDTLLEHLKLLNLGELFSKFDLEFFRKAVIFSNSIRERYTVLDLLEELGILEDFSHFVIDEIRQLGFFS